MIAENHPTRICFVEDEDAIGMGLTYSLNKAGYEVALWKTAAETKQAWAPGKYDLILLDINLPDGSGYDVFT